MSEPASIAIRSSSTKALVQQPIALDAERETLRGADTLAADGDGRADRLGVGDQHLRLDRLALKRMLDDSLHSARRAPGDRDAAGIGHRDRAVAPDHLLGDRCAVGAGGKIAGPPGHAAPRARVPDVGGKFQEAEPGMTGGTCGAARRFGTNFPIIF